MPSPPAAPPAPDILLCTRGLTKRFGATLALSDLAFDLRAGELHVLFGENGAGKSTLVKILSGVYRADAGQVLVRGQPTQLHHPHQARKAGIVTVFQDFSLLPSMSVLDNLFLGEEIRVGPLIHRSRMAARAQEVLRWLEFEVDVSRPVGSLGRAGQQMVEIAKALLNEVSVLILDEPTSSLTLHETEHLFRIIAQLKARGVGIIFISHRMSEVMTLGDRVTVMRDGQKVTTLQRGEFSQDELIQLTAGRQPKEIYPPRPPLTPQGAPLLSVSRLSTASGLRGVTFTLCPGEVLGLAGLAGSGTSEVGRALFGLEHLSGGSFTLNGDPVSRPTPSALLRRGVMYFPADRHREGIIGIHSIKQNATLEALPRLFTRTLGFLGAREEKQAVQELTTRLAVKMPGIDAPIGTLSGGNQQKVLLARGLLRNFNVFIFDDPTIGVDILTKVEIYRMIGQLAAQGAGVLLISSDVSEVLGVSHRVMVMRHGLNVATVDAETTGEDELVRLFFDQGDLESPLHAEPPASEATPPEIMPLQGVRP